jgi:hypothetical protein
MNLEPKKEYFKLPFTAGHLAQNKKNSISLPWTSIGKKGIEVSIMKEACLQKDC